MPPFDRAIYAMTTVRYLSAYDARVLLRAALEQLEKSGYVLMPKEKQ